MKYMTLTDTLTPLGFYSEDIHGDLKLPTGEPNPDCKIPKEAIPITDDQWLEFIANNGQRSWNPSTSKVVVYTALPTIQELRDSKRYELEQQYTACAQLPVSVDGVAWTSGLESYSRLKLVYDAAVLLSTPTVDFYDVGNVKHTLTLATATGILQSIFQQHQRLFGIKQDYLVELTVTNTRAGLNGLVFNFTQ